MNRAGRSGLPGRPGRAQPWMRPSPVVSKQEPLDPDVIEIGADGTFDLSPQKPKPPRPAMSADPTPESPPRRPPPSFGNIKPKPSFANIRPKPSSYTTAGVAKPGAGDGVGGPGPAESAGAEDWAGKVAAGAAAVDDAAAAAAAAAPVAAAAAASGDGTQPPVRAAPSFGNIKPKPSFANIRPKPSSYTAAGAAKPGAGDGVGGPGPAEPAGAEDGAGKTAAEPVEAAGAGAAAADDAAAAVDAVDAVDTIGGAAAQSPPARAAPSFGNIKPKPSFANIRPKPSSYTTTGAAKPGAGDGVGRPGPAVREPAGLAPSTAAAGGGAQSLVNGFMADTGQASQNASIAQEADDFAADFLAEDSMASDATQDGACPASTGPHAAGGSISSTPSTEDGAERVPEEPSVPAEAETKPETMPPAPVSESAAPTDGSDMSNSGSGAAAAEVVETADVAAPMAINSSAALSAETPAPADRPVPASAAAGLATQTAAQTPAQSVPVPAALPLPSAPGAAPAANQTQQPDAIKPGQAAPPPSPPAAAPAAAALAGPRLREMVVQKAFEFINNPTVRAAAAQPNGLVRLQEYLRKQMNIMPAEYTAALQRAGLIPMPQPQKPPPPAVLATSPQPATRAAGPLQQPAAVAQAQSPVLNHAPAGKVTSPVDLKKHAPIKCGKWQHTMEYESNALAALYSEAQSDATLVVGPAQSHSSSDPILGPTPPPTMVRVQTMALAAHSPKLAGLLLSRPQPGGLPARTLRIEFGLPAVQAAIYFCYTGRLQFSASETMDGRRGGTGGAVSSGLAAEKEAAALNRVGPELVKFSREYGLTALAAAATTAIIAGLTVENVCDLLQRTSTSNMMFSRGLEHPYAIGAATAAGVKGVPRLASAAQVRAPHHSMDYPPTRWP